MKVTFKNVGQGDTLLLEWEKEGEQHYGVIDCKGKALVNHLAGIKSLKTLDFVVLSHPHNDHYSGMTGLFKHCLKKKIRVNEFYLPMFPKETMPKLKKEYFTKGEDKAFKKLNDSLKSLHDEGLLGCNDYIKDGKSFDLNENYRLECFSPSRVEIDTLFNREKIEQLFNLHSDIYNTISTVFALSSISHDEYFLLTADAIVETFERLTTHGGFSSIKHKAGAVQVPHHGSKKNLHEDFWKKLKRKKKAKAVISVGDSDYKHPDKDVVEFYHAEGYHLIATNYVNGLRTATTNSKGPNPLSVFDSLSDASDEGQDVELVFGEN